LEQSSSDAGPAEMPGFGAEQTSTGLRLNFREAPIPAVRWTTIGRLKSTLSSRS
jgi:hypothetical protein